MLLGPNESEKLTGVLHRLDYAEPRITDIKPYRTLTLDRKITVATDTDKNPYPDMEILNGFFRPGF